VSVHKAVRILDTSGWLLLIPCDNNEDEDDNDDDEDEDQEKDDDGDDDDGDDDGDEGEDQDGDEDDNDTEEDMIMDQPKKGISTKNEQAIRSVQYEEYKNEINIQIIKNNTCKP
jgi:hypothetical protein